MFPGGIGSGEILVILILAVVLFGRNLPQVARNLGGYYQQLRKGLSDMHRSFTVEDEPNSPYSASRLPAYRDSKDQWEQPAAPRFVTPPDDSAKSD